MKVPVATVFSNSYKPCSMSMIFLLLQKFEMTIGLGDIKISMSRYIMRVIITIIDIITISF